MSIVGTALATVAGLALLVADGPAATVSPGDVVASNHLTAGCPTEELAVAMNPAGLAASSPALARMAQAHCKAIAPDTRLLITAPAEKGAMRVQPASGIAEPLFVMTSDFDLVSRRR